MVKVFRDKLFIPILQLSVIYKADILVRLVRKCTKIFSSLFLTDEFYNKTSAVYVANIIRIPRLLKSYRL